jgi:hypothetical protein
MNPHDPRMPAVMDKELHWKRCKTAREMYLQSGAQLWIAIGQQAGCPWTVSLSGAEVPSTDELKSPKRFAPLAVAATALVFSGIALAVGRR